jgi:transcriptional regulator with XRE-family HTH domain
MTDSIYRKEYKNVIERLKEARLNAGLKQEEVAVKLGKPQSYVSKIERGERRVDIAEIKIFAKVYQKPMDFFIK